MRYDCAALAMLQAFLFGSGPATVLPLETQAYIKSSPELEVPDLEFMLRGSPPLAGRIFRSSNAPTSIPGASILCSSTPRAAGPCACARPTRRPGAHHYNYLSAPADIAKFRQGFRMAREIGRQLELDAFRGEELEPGADVTNDEDVDHHLGRTATTVSHAASTCRMGLDEGCVLDPQLRVRGIDALRVIDASVFPDLVSAHINAAVYTVAEKAADLLWGRAAWPSQAADVTR